MPTIPPDFLQFGIAGLLFVVWAYTFRHFSQSVSAISKEHNEAVKSLAEKTGDAYQTAIDDGKKMNKELIDLVRENAREEQEVKAHLIRILTRMEEKLDKPLRCPMSVASRRGDNDA